MPQSPTPLENRLLAALPPDAYQQLRPNLELVSLTRAQTTYESTGPVNHLHFPTTAMISAFVDLPNGASAEIALVGRDGATGVTELMCGIRAPFRMVVDTTGHAYRLKLSLLRDDAERYQALQPVLMRYFHARMVQVAANVVCNSQHSVQQRLCRALLMRLERVSQNSLYVTQEMLARILAVRRPAITKAAASLKRSGAIAYTRGRLTVLDAELLHECACECYEAVKGHIGAVTP